MPGDGFGHALGAPPADELGVIGFARRSRTRLLSYGRPMPNAPIASALAAIATMAMANSSPAVSRSRSASAGRKMAGVWQVTFRRYYDFGWHGRRRLRARSRLNGARRSAE